MQSLSTVYSKGHNCINLSGQSIFEKNSADEIVKTYYCSPNGPIDICKMSNRCFAKTARYLLEMLSRCLKDSFFANLSSVQQRPCLDILKSHFRYTQTCVLDTAKTTYEDVFKISKRQLFCKSNQCLSKPLFR